MIEFGEPCFKCGVRPDIACKHRPATEPPREAQGKVKTRAARNTALHWKLAKGYRPTKSENENG